METKLWIEESDDWSRLGLVAICGSNAVFVGGVSITIEKSSTSPNIVEHTRAGKCQIRKRIVQIAPTQIPCPCAHHAMLYLLTW